MSFSNILIDWYLQNKRELPWREYNHPYAIWLSEIILQQTRIEQGLSYYEKFLKEFPTIFDLAKASENKVLKLWQGLGYYSRARNLHATAKFIVSEYDGHFPKTYKELLRLKGVGDYTASAIASICFNEAAAAVDGNVYRVLARYFGIDIPINSTTGKKTFKELAQNLIDTERPGTYNQAVMEFGALMCKPQNPKCTICPLQSACKAFDEKTIDQLPVKNAKTNVKKRHFNYLVLEGNKTLLKKRTGNGIWKNLYEFPLVESDREIDFDELLQSELFNELFGYDNVSVNLFNHEPIMHKLSHQHLSVKFWIVKSEKMVKNAILWSSFERYPVPVVIANFVNKFKFND